MFPPILLLATAVVAVSAVEYPAGVSPFNCPNYPYCGDSPYFVNDLYEPITHTVQGYPANVNPALCPNYPYCYLGVVGHHIPVLPYAPVPANVDPVKCPNYPYCQLQ